MSLIIGSHVEVSGNDMLLGAVNRAVSYDATTFMLYTGSPQSRVLKPISAFRKDEAYQVMKEHNIDPNHVIVHAPYLINLANTINQTTYEQSVLYLKEELNRVNELGFKTVVLHPGSHVGTGVEVGINQVIKGLNEVLDNDNSDVKIAIETMAGKGNEVGFTFEQVNTIITSVNKKERVGVCLDTCHIHDAGYDIINNYDTVVNEFDRVISIDKLLVLHVNDSKNVCGARKDRHENFGYGYIGYDTLIKFIYDERFSNIPKILETPYIEEQPPYYEEIKMIRAKVFNPSLKEKVVNV
jgi:deoxyribonuclease-4